MAFSFRGGLSLDGRKLTAGEPIQTMPAPNLVTIPLLQNKSEPAVPEVAMGERVLKGQRIAATSDGQSVYHASVSGKVLSVSRVMTTLGESEAIVLENDHKDEICPSVQPFSKPIGKAEPEELIAHIRAKGIAGMGGKAFPTAQKLEAARGKATRIVINCAESEPYLTSDHRLLLEKTAEVVAGVKILLRATGCERAIFALESNKENAVPALQRVFGKSPSFAVAVCRTKYPQGDEKHLVSALTGSEIPAGMLPIDMGLVIFNVETCYAVYRAFVTGMPAVERLVTVSGDCIKTPSNLIVPIGTAFADVIQNCGGTVCTPDRILSGGPMMGEAVPEDSVPVTKCVSAVIALRVPDYREENCIRCGRCSRLCPIRLMPMELYDAVKRNKEKKALAYSIEACSECGLCTYICPARLPLTETIREGKGLFDPSRKGEEDGTK